MTEAAELAIVATAPDQVGASVMALGRLGCNAAIVTGDATDLDDLARASGVRVLGPGSFGIAAPAIGLNATLSHAPIRPGRVALVSQSSSLCRAVIDWAEPNGIGFSYVVGLGGNHDFGFSGVLDWLSHDSGTGPILLDLRRIKQRRAFISAARAAARLRPVVAIRAGVRLGDPTGVSEAALAAALHRAGVVGVSSLEEFLAAAETLTRARPLRSEGLAIVSNARTLGRLAADVALRLGLSLAEPSAATKTALALTMPEARLEHGLLQTDSWQPIRLAEGAAVLAAGPETGGVLVLMAPSGPRDEAGVAALIAGHKAVRVPLLVCVVGETTGAVHRRRLAEAGLPVFALPEQAVRGFQHLIAFRRSREAARELPPSTVLSLTPDTVRVRALIAAAFAADRLTLTAQEAAACLAAYGVPVAAPAAAETSASALGLAMLEDAMMGPVILLTRNGRIVAVDLPPLNLSLAHMLAAGAPPPVQEPLAEILVRISQLVVDCPEIAALGIGRLIVGAAGSVAAAEPAIRLHRHPDRRRLAIAPYPAELVGTFDARGEPLCVRPIRPEDAEAHAGFFHRLAPQDVRFRFFSAMREISPEQMARMTQVDYTREMAFVAVREATGETVGVSRLIHEPGENSAEFAVVVEPAMKGRGLASHLMQRLFDWAQTAGVGEIVGLVLADNAPMLAFVRRLGFTVRHLPDEPDVMEARRPIAS
jgi:acyl-CoA synthetase (NDP forming)/RimJ/RimL family protein N-acetyltransferase